MTLKIMRILLLLEREGSRVSGTERKLSRLLSALKSTKKTIWTMKKRLFLGTKREKLGQSLPNLTCLI